MQTQCSFSKMELEGVGRRKIEADFSGGQISSDGGGLLLREVDRRLRLTERLAACFTDHRKPDLIDHSVEELLRQRAYGLALGYEDLNDHEALSRDPLLATLVGKKDPVGDRRRQKKHKGLPLASASTLGRIERTKADASRESRYEKVVCNFGAMGDICVDVFVESFDEAPVYLVLDLDPSDIQLHGNQEQRFFHGYYDHYCYLPMYLFCGEYPLAVKLRPANIDGALGAAEMLAPVVEKLRAAFPGVVLLIRGDSGFAREELMSWCEQNDLEYLFGMAKNERLVSSISKQMEQARRDHLATGEPARCYRSFSYRTRESWSRSRRVVGKAEYLDKGENPRFVVTSLPNRLFEKRYLYEDLYCARGEMENRIKEQQLDLFGTRTSCHTFRGNEVRIWLSVTAHLLVVGLRRVGLVGTELARAQASTLRVKLFKIGAQVAVSVRRVYIQLSTAYPLKELFASVIERLRSPPLNATA
ncbi:MAG: IS1380 family transposase [Pseudomonadota bacterium]